MSEAGTEFLREGDNCWKHSNIERGTFLIGGETYFSAFRKAVINAERWVNILAWDLMEDIDLVRGQDPADGFPVKLADFLFAVADARSDLEIRILLWDYSLVYLAERDWLPFSQWKLDGHPRVIVEQDQAISLGVSHHQKVVVIDGGFAFCGGLDLSAWRWDTLEHKAVDPRRVDPKGEPYQPYHDIHMAVTGQVARDLQELFRLRWQRATGDGLVQAEGDRGREVWPVDLPVDFENVEAGIALTFSRYKDYAPCRQIEQLHLDLIRCAERYIYIENQYLSSHVIVDALIERLQQADGPEVILILTHDTGGWMEEGTLGLLRERLLERLDEADLHNRLGVYYPFVADESGNSSQVYVHAKLSIVDDNTVEIGSANLSNRSMKVDSEVDLVIRQNSVFPAAQKLLRRLLAVHFNTSSEKVHEQLEASASINGAIRVLQKQHLHKLVDFEFDCGGPLRRKLADSQWLDPDEPIDPGYWMRKAVSGVNAQVAPAYSWRKYLKYALWLVAGLLAAYALKQAWGSVIDKESLDQFFSVLRGSVWLIPSLLSIFFVAGLIAVPINLLLVASTLALGPWVTFLCGFVGSLLSAFAGFGAGHFGGKPILEKLFEQKINDLSQKIGNRGVFSVALIRVVPIAPFVVINLVAGISQLKFRIFATGSVVGMLPGMLGVVLVTYQAKNAVTDPSWQTWALLAGLVIVLIGGAYAIKKYSK